MSFSTWFIRLQRTALEQPVMESLDQLKDIQTNSSLSQLVQLLWVFAYYTWYNYVQFRKIKFQKQIQSHGQV
jgi:hypothetical protein